MRKIAWIQTIWFYNLQRAPIYHSGFSGVTTHDCDTGPVVGVSGSVSLCNGYHRISPAQTRVSPSFPRAARLRSRGRGGQRAQISLHYINTQNRNSSSPARKNHMDPSVCFWEYGPKIYYWPKNLTICMLWMGTKFWAKYLLNEGT